MVFGIAANRFTARLERVGTSATMIVSGPADLAAALAHDPDAERAFAELSFTHRREYVDWIEEAKRPETRRKRVAGTVERVRARGSAP